MFANRKKTQEKMPEFPPLGDYMIEYSKSSRSKCKLTGKNIPQSVLRIGKIVRSEVDSFGGNYPEWYNFEGKYFIITPPSSSITNNI